MWMYDDWNIVMKVIDRILHGINFKVVWFADEPVKESGIITYHQAAYEGKNATKFETLINKLDEDEEGIKSHFSKSCKYKVNRAAREDVDIVIKSPEQISDEDIESFLTFFTAFWDSKGTKFDNYDSVKRDLRDIRDANGLTIAYAKVAGQIAIYHTHIYDEKTARLLHSASLYRLQGDEEGNTKNLIGMANRYLHFKEMLHFKSLGIEEYDWGGAGIDDDVKNITEFKESFGGFHRTYYDFEEVRGLKAHLFKILVALREDVLNIE